MSDESRTVLPGANIHVNHYCCKDGCGSWGGFGMTDGKKESSWWCWKHYPNKPNQVRFEATEIADALSA